MTTCYFDRNIFDQIDKVRDVTEEDLGLLREAIRQGTIQILVSFETVQETAQASKDTALRGLKLISEITRAAFPIKPHTELVNDDIQSFAAGKQQPSAFLSGRFSLESVIKDVAESSPEIIALLKDDKKERDGLNAKLRKLVEDERKMLGGQRPRTFQAYWDTRSHFYGEGFAHYAGVIKQCNKIGIDRLLELRSVRVSVGALLSWLYALMIEGRAVKDGTARDIQHAGPMSAADIVVTDDRELRRLMTRIPIDNFSIINLPELITLIRSNDLT